MDLAVVDSSSELVDIGEVLQAEDKVIDEPGCMLCPVSDVLLSLLVSGDFLLAPTWT